MKTSALAREIFAVVLFLTVPTTAYTATVDSLRLMTFNVWKGENTAEGRDKIVDIIVKTDADIIGSQEMSHVAGEQVAAALGFHWGRGVLSRYPINSTPNIYDYVSRGSEIQLSPSQTVWIQNTHLPSEQNVARDLKNGILPQVEADVIAAAEASRGNLLDDIFHHGLTSKIASGNPTFFLGDFNEPSYLDWTAAAAAATTRAWDLKVEFPASKQIVDSGITDSFRYLRPDEVNDPGYTRDPFKPDQLHDQDRIDFIYYSGLGVTPTEAISFGLDADNPNTDVAIDGWNSDHRALVVDFTLTVPEPSSVAVLGSGILGMAIRRRRSVRLGCVGLPASATMSAT